MEKHVSNKSPLDHPELKSGSPPSKTPNHHEKLEDPIDDDSTCLTTIKNPALDPQNSKAASQKKKYQNISNDLRVKLIKAVQLKGERIKHAANRLDINYSSAKSICQVFKQEGRMNKKSCKDLLQQQKGNTGSDISKLSRGKSEENSQKDRNTRDEDQLASVNEPPLVKKIHSDTFPSTGLSTLSQMTTSEPVNPNPNSNEQHINKTSPNEKVNMHHVSEKPLNVHFVPNYPQLQHYQSQHPLQSQYSLSTPSQSSQPVLHYQYQVQSQAHPMQPQYQLQPQPPIVCLNTIMESNGVAAMTQVNVCNPPNQNPMYSNIQASGPAQFNGYTQGLYPIYNFGTGPINNGCPVIMQNPYTPYNNIPGPAAYQPVVYYMPVANPQLLQVAPPSFNSRPNITDKPLFEKVQQQANPFTDYLQSRNNNTKALEKR